MATFIGRSEEKQELLLSPSDAKTVKDIETPELDTAKLKSFSNPNESLGPNNTEREPDAYASKKIHGEVFNQAMLFANLALPTIIVNFGSQLIWVISTSTTGREIGSEALGGFALATLIGNLLGKSFIYGFLTGFDTLAGAAIGAHNYEEVGLLLQRMIVVSLIIFVVISIFWLNVEPILVWLGQPDEVVLYSKRFLRIYCYVYPIDMLIELLKSFYRCQNICIPFAYMMLLVCPMHYFILNHFIERYGFDGVGYTHMASSSLFLVIIFIYMFTLRQHNPETWKGFNFHKTFNRTHFSEFLSLGIPGIFGMSEWWYWEIQTLFVGTVGASQLAAHSIAYNVLPIYFHIPYGVAIAVQTRVATIMAEGDPYTAKRVALTAMGVAALIGASNSATCYLLKDRIYEIFLDAHDPNLNENDVIAAADTIWPLVSILTFFDAQLALGYGVFRGLSMHARLSVVMIVGLFIIGVPIEILFGYKLGWGLWGFWFGMFVTYISLDCFLFLTVISLDWRRIQVPLEAVQPSQ